MGWPWRCAAVKGLRDVVVRVPHPTRAGSRRGPGRLGEGGRAAASAAGRVRDGSALWGWSPPVGYHPGVRTDRVGESYGRVGWARWPHGGGRCHPGVPAGQPRCPRWCRGRAVGWEQGQGEGSAPTLCLQKRLLALMSPKDSRGRFV